MSSRNIAKTQHLFGELSLKNNKSSTQSTAGSPLLDGLRSSAFQKKSPEIHDLIRFQNAIMMKYYQTQDPHFKNMANALKPQIEDKIREFNQRN